MTGVEGYYDQNAQYEWDRLERHRTEFAVTMRALRDYLPCPPAKILDVGGGPGRYAIALTERGYGVTVVDLSKDCLEFARAKAKEAGVTLDGYVHCDARDLSSFAEHGYDAVLLMGPLYHLLSETDRRSALNEAARVLKAGGTIVASFITRYAPIRFWARYKPAHIVEHWRQYEEFLATGVLEAPDEGGGFPDAHFAHPLEVKPFMEEAGFRTVELIGCEGVVSHIEEMVNSLSGEFWETWVEENYRFGKDPTILGAAEHLLYVGSKKGSLRAGKRGRA